MAEEEVVTNTTPSENGSVAVDLKRKSDNLHPEEAEAEEKISPPADLLKEELDSNTTKARLDDDESDVSVPQNGHKLQKSDTVEAEKEQIINTADPAAEVTQHENSPIGEPKAKAKAEENISLLGDLPKGVSVSVDQNGMAIFKLSLQERAKADVISPALQTDVSTYERLIEDIKSFSFPPKPEWRLYGSEDESINNEHYKHYIELVKESQGCYVPKVPEDVIVASYRPVAVPNYSSEHLESSARDALHWYNEGNKEGETYEFVRVECGSFRSLGCQIKYHVAFIARRSVSHVEEPFRARSVSHVEEPFRATVIHGVLGKITVESCVKVLETCERFTELNGCCCKASIYLQKEKET